MAFSAIEKVGFCQGWRSNLSGEEGEYLADDGIESLADLGLLVHLNVQPVWHLVILKINFLRMTGSFFHNLDKLCRVIKNYFGTDLEPIQSNKQTKTNAPSCSYG